MKSTKVIARPLAQSVTKLVDDGRITADEARNFIHGRCSKFTLSFGGTDEMAVLPIQPLSCLVDEGMEHKIRLRA
ncbi:hypothetical protein [Ensifer aridi]|uniref:hypothetical protein n=1 Tax=Ensifer aridi TaxID=1708715 RepID=UPI0015E387F8|nr:hypothetical protein [Ensifer aridi]